MYCIKKIDDIVKSISKNIQGGNKFFDMLDLIIKDPKNLDLTLSLYVQSKKTQKSLASVMNLLNILLKNSKKV
jgi:hypothetical protein